MDVGALAGWLRYAPLLLRLRAGGQRSVYREGIEAMRRVVGRAAPVLALRLGLGGGSRRLPRSSRAATSAAPAT